MTQRGMMSLIRSSLAAAGRWLRSVRPERQHLRADFVAGLPGAIGSVPDGMAAAVLAGVNPVQGLYAGFAGPIAGGLTSSTRLMVITTTSAASLAAGSALKSVPPGQRPEALLLLALMAGVVLVAAGLAGAWPVHPVRVLLGDDRVSDRDLRQHRVRAGGRPDRRAGSKSAQPRPHSPASTSRSWMCMAACCTPGRAPCKPTCPTQPGHRHRRWCCDSAAVPRSEPPSSRWSATTPTASLTSEAGSIPAACSPALRSDSTAPGPSMVSMRPASSWCPLDEDRTSFRYHHLVHQLLRAELRARDWTW